MVSKSSQKKKEIDDKVSNVFFTVVLLSGLILTLALVMIFGRVTSVQADPGARYVAPGGNCNGAAPCYGSVQAAVDAAIPGDEIRAQAIAYYYRMRKE